MKKLTVRELIDALLSVSQDKEINVCEDVIRGDGWKRQNKEQ